MTDSIFSDPSPSSSIVPPSESSVQDILAQATVMANEGGPGANADKAQAWLQQQMQVQGAQPTSSIFDSPGTYKPVSTETNAPDSKTSMAINSLKSTLGDTFADSGNALKNAGQDVKNLGTSIFNYGKNFSQEHATESKGPVTQDQMKALKLLGGNPMDVAIWTGKGPTGFEWQPTYKMSQEERDKSLTPEQKAEQQRANNQTFANFDAVAALKKNTEKYVGMLTDPHMAATKAYANVGDVTNAMQVLQSPDKFDPKQVDSAKKYLDALKAQKDKGVIASALDNFKEMYKNPAQSVAGLIDPVMALAPELKGMGLAKASAVGAGTNEVLSDLQQRQDKGYVNPKEEQAAGLMGASLGAIFHSVGKASEVLPKGKATGEVPPEGGAPNSDNTPPHATETALVRQGGTGGEPGEPMHASTPVHDAGVIPYAGGVTKDLSGIHIHKDFPTELPMKNRAGENVTLPVKDIVAQVHEAEEAPLMHPQGPVPLNKLAQIVNRAGKYGNQNIFSKEILEKIASGKALSYPEAHEIATAIENNHVATTYNVDPKVYQNSLKPHIKDITESAAKEGKGAVPDDLDSKPYDDMGHPEQLPEEGEGAPSGKKGQSGRVDPRLLATGAAVAGGSIFGAYEADKDHKLGGALLGGAAGLFASLNHMGESIPTRGFGNSQRGMFAGPLSRVHSSALETEARTMKAQGKTPAQINFKTGMYEGAGGHFYSQISDKDAVVHTNKIWTDKTVATNMRNGKGTPLSTLMDHKELDKAYPGLAEKIKVHLDPRGRGASYDFNTGNITISTPDAYPKTGLDTFKNVLLHEVNHAIQHYEGFPRGDSPTTHIKALQAHVEQLDARLVDIDSRLREAKVDGNDRYAITLQKERDMVQAQMDDLSKDKIHKIAWDRYNRSAGENMSVMTQERADLSPEQLRMQVPTPGTPNEGQIVKYNTSPSPHLTNVPSLQEEGIAAHSISSHLQKTGDADEEGNLHGMILDEDKLPNESVVVANAAKGNQQAIGTLYKKYMPRLERSLRNTMREAGPRLGIGSEDIASIAFTKAMQALPEFQGGSSFYTWLYKIGRNEALNAIQKGNRQVPTTTMHTGLSNVPGVSAAQGGIEDTGSNPIKSNVEAVASTGDTPEAMAQAQQTSNMVQYAISKLPQDIKNAIKMREFEGLDYEEIAERQGVPVGTVRSRLNRGRDMLAQSIKKGHGANFNKVYSSVKEGGKIDPKLLKSLGMFAAGAIIGGYLASDHRIRGAIAGGLLFSWLGNHYAEIPGITNRIVHNEKAISIQDMIDLREKQITMSTLAAKRMGFGMKQLVPALKDRESVAYALDGTPMKLTPNQEAMRKTVKSFFDGLGKTAVANGVIKAMVNNYITHLVKEKVEPTDFIDAIQKVREKGGGASSFTPFARERKFPTIQEIEAAGFHLVTKDPLVLAQIYAKSMATAIANKQLKETLQTTPVPGKKGQMLVMPAGSAPSDYIMNPRMPAYKVNPNIASALDMVFHFHQTGAGETALSALNTAHKRLNVSGSMMHALNLALAHVSAGGPHLIRSLKEVYQSARGTSPGQREMYQPGKEDPVGLGISQGLRVRMTDEDIDPDYFQDFYPGLQKLRDALEGMLPGLGKVSDAIKYVNEKSDHFIFNTLQTGLKINTYLHQLETLQKTWAAEQENKPGTIPPTKEQMARQAASATNEFFGSLDYRRLAEEAQTNLGKTLSYMMYSPTGRRLTQFAFFAPDWTISQMRAFTKALDLGTGLRDLTGNKTFLRTLGHEGGSGPKGLFTPKTGIDLRRQYQIWTLIFQVLVAGMFQYALTGHGLDKNKNPTRIEFGDGTFTEWNPHGMGPYQFMLHPKQTILNKLNAPIKEPLMFLEDKDYLNAEGTAPPYSDPLSHLGAMFFPIGLSMDQGIGRSAASRFIGIYGYTKEQREEKNKERAIDKQKKAREKMEKMMQDRMNANGGE